MNNSKGLQTNAVYGFTTMLLKVLRDHRPDYVAVVCADFGSPSAAGQQAPGRRVESLYSVDYISALAEAEDRSGHRDTWVWKMRPEVASALEELGLTT